MTINDEVSPKKYNTVFLWVSLGIIHCWTIKIIISHAGCNFKAFIHTPQDVHTPGLT